MGLAWIDRISRADAEPKLSWAAAVPLALMLISTTIAGEGIGAPVSDIIAVDPASGNFVDTLGRARFFRGVNAVSKLPPFHPALSGFDPVHSLSRIDAEALRSWGFNVVRLGVLWQGVMPQPGVVNASYLDAIDKIVSTLADAGVYTILDAHQDCLGRRFCGEGLPDWVILKSLRIAGVNVSDPKEAFPKPFPWDLGGDRDGLPDLAKCQSHNFVDYYNTKVSLASWRALYTTKELWDDFAQHWQAVANRFARRSSVLGYELLNECVRTLTRQNASSALASFVMASCCGLFVCSSCTDRGEAAQMQIFCCLYTVACMSQSGV